MWVRCRMCVFSTSIRWGSGHCSLRYQWVLVSQRRKKIKPKWLSEQTKSWAIRVNIPHFSSQLGTTSTSNLNFTTVFAVLLECCSLPQFHLQNRVRNAYLQRRISCFTFKTDVEIIDQWSRNLIHNNQKKKKLPNFFCFPGIFFKSPLLLEIN